MCDIATQFASLTFRNYWGQNCENKRRLEALTAGKRYKLEPYNKYRLPLEAACVYVDGVK